MSKLRKNLSAEQHEELLSSLETRFNNNPNRHRGMGWEIVQTRLEAHPEKLWSLYQMEVTGGEPDIVGLDKTTGEYLFFDCVSESPKGRRSLCYDNEALGSRKKHKPKNSAINLADELDIELLTETQYRELQQLGEFDLKTSSWVATPAAVRKLGGALFCDRRFGQVFVYHNGAESYYGSRGFRGVVRV